MAGSLRLCGAWVGEQDALIKANVENPKGFWERRDVRDICDALMHAANADWWDVADFHPDNIPLPMLSEYGDKFRSIVNILSEKGTWTFKEPRLCLLLPLLRTHIPNAICVHVYRHPVEVARSLRARNEFGIAEGLALWEAYTQSALRASMGLRRLLISYEELISHPHPTLESLVGQLQQLGVTGLTTPPREMLDDFIAPAHRRQGPGLQPLEYLKPSQRDLWALLENGEALHTNPSDSLPADTLQLLRDLASRKLSFEKLSAQAEAAAKVAQEKFETQKRRSKSLFRTLTALRQQVRDMQIERKAIYESSSWAITAPLRAAHFALGKMRGRFRQGATPASQTESGRDQEPSRSTSGMRETRTSTAKAETPITVLISSRNRPIYLWACLDALWRYTRLPHRFILVDMASDDGLIPEVIRGFERRGMFAEIVQAERNDPNIFAGVVMHHLDSWSPYFAYIESDVMVEETSPCWLERMVSLMDAYPSLAMLGSAIDRRDFIDPASVEHLRRFESDKHWHALMKTDSQERKQDLARAGGKPMYRPQSPAGRLLVLRTMHKAGRTCDRRGSGCQSASGRIRHGHCHGRSPPPPLTGAAIRLSRIRS